jgi:transcriptional regulator with XRE-family HTH domain
MLYWAYHARMDYVIQAPGQLASHLPAMRRARAWSQAQLGAALGVGQSRITRIERDPTMVSVGQFVELLNALGVQMVLRAPDARPHPAARPKPMRVSRASRTSPHDEPW